MEPCIDAFFEAVSAAYETLFGTPCPDSLLEASEGDARKYMKKAIEANGLSGKLTEMYGPNWSEAAFRKIRDLFVHHGCDEYFIPGLARISYGELALGGYGENGRGLNQLCELVAFITTAHKNEFSRNLEHITTVQQGPQKGMKVRSAPMSLRELSDMFTREQEEDTEAQRKAFIGTDGGNGYKVIELDSFETAQPFLKYTIPSSPWCYFENEETFNAYSANGNRLYLALAPGFENLKPGDRGYGRSMIGFDMGPIGPDGTSKLCACTNRYNHSNNMEAVKDEETGKLIDPDTGKPPKKGDAAYNEIQLSNILGVPVWRTYLGFNLADVIREGKFDETVLARVFDSKDALLNAIENPDALLEKYNIIVKQLSPGLYGVKSASPDNNPTPNFWRRDPEFRCIVVVNGPGGNPFWAREYRRLPNDANIVFGRQGDFIIDGAGNPIVQEVFSETRPAEQVGFPIAVSRGKAVTENGYDSRLLKWNFIDEKGNFLCDQWFNNVTEFNRDGYARVGMVNQEENINRINVINTKGQFMLPEWAKHLTDGYGIDIGGNRFHIAEMADNSIFIIDLNFKPIHNVPFAEISVMYDESKTRRFGCRKVQHAVTKKYSIFDPGSRKFLIDWYDYVSDVIYYAPLVFEYVQVTNERNQVNFVQLRKGLLSDVWFNGAIKLCMRICEREPLFYVGLRGGVGVWSPNFGLITKKPVGRVFSLPYTESHDTRYVITKTGDTVSLWDATGNSHVATEQELRTIQEMSQRSQIDGIAPRWM